jgi:hypothetical protein
LSVESGEVEGFENYGTGKGAYPTCYIVGSQTSKNGDYIPYCSTDYAHTGKASLIIKTDEENNKAYAITNSLDVEDIADARLNFWGYTKYPNSSYAHSIVVGVLTTPADLVLSFLLIQFLCLRKSVHMKFISTIISTTLMVREVNLSCSILSLINLMKFLLMMYLWVKHQIVLLVSILMKLQLHHLNFALQLIMRHIK